MPYGGRNFDNLDSSSVLEPVDLVTICADLAWMLDAKREDLVDWYRPLGIALFERFGLAHLPQRRAFAEATQGADLMRALGAVDTPNWFDGLGRAWSFRRPLLALPNLVAGVLEGHPFQLSVRHREMPPPLRPMAEDIANDLLSHSFASVELAQHLDQMILLLWGCPQDRLEQKVTGAELAAAGLKLQTFLP